MRRSATRALGIVNRLVHRLRLRPVCLHSQEKRCQQCLPSIGLLATLLFLGGCGIGPLMVERDRLDYQNAMSESWKRQILMNLVRTRYADAPVFLEVSSIINQYSAEADASAQVTLNTPWSAQQQYQGLGRYYDRPTITYAPLTGEKFARSLLTPIPPPSLVALVQAGWPVDFMFRLACTSINGVDNASSGALQNQGAAPLFEELLATLRRIQISDSIGMRFERKGNQETATIFIGHHTSEANKADLARIAEILGLDPQARELRLVFGDVSTSKTELALQSRSMMQILVELGACIDVPEEHLASGMTFRPPGGSQDTKLMAIRSGRNKPANAFAAVPYKGYWYWIDDGDFKSKRALSLMMVFFSLTESGSGAGAPVVTINAGG